MRSCSGGDSGGGALLTATAALAMAMAQGKSAREIDLLSAFFVALGDNLALLSLHAPDESESGGC